jgi:hypothetical protein
MPWQWVITLTLPPEENLYDLWQEWLATRWDQANDYGRPSIDWPAIPFVQYGIPSQSFKFYTEADRQRLDYQRAQIAQIEPSAWPFWVAVFARHPRRSGRTMPGEAIVESGRPHIHMLVGSVSRSRMQEILSTWPGRIKLTAIYSPWKILHYTFAQALTVDHAADLWSHCDNLMIPPAYSENFDHVLIAVRHRERMKREAKKYRVRRKLAS